MRRDRNWFSIIATGFFIIVAVIIVVTMSFTVFFKSKVHTITGSIVGNTYECQFYSNSGEKFMTMTGEKIDLNSNYVRERKSSNEGYTETLSSVMTITIDGSQVESCGSSILFIETGLKPDVDYREQIAIHSQAEGFEDNTFIANIVNHFKNMSGKPVIVVIQSQLGDPICSFSGDEVYWEVCEDLPKTTKLMIDGKALYIHRANFQIIDKDLLD